MNLYSNPTLAKLGERFERLTAQYGYSVLDPDNFYDFIRQPGESLIMLTEDPQKVPETWDMLVILPELLKGLPDPPRVGLLAPAAARTVAPRFGIRLWPALLALRGGDYLGTIEGFKDWSIFAVRLPQLLAAPASRPPMIGIPVQTIGATASSH